MLKERTSMDQVKKTMHEHNAAINRDGLLLQVNPAHCPRRTDKGRDDSLLCRAEKVWEHCKLICKVQRGFILVLYFRIQNQEKKFNALKISFYIHLSILSILYSYKYLHLSDVFKYFCKSKSLPCSPSPQDIEEEFGQFDMKPKHEILIYQLIHKGSNT